VRRRLVRNHEGQRAVLMHVPDEEPRHAEREAGLIITFDLCPAGLMYEVSTSLQNSLCGLANQWPALLELDYPSRALAARAMSILRWCHGSSARC
jgi:hypothetical protein